MLSRISQNKTWKIGLTPLPPPDRIGGVPLSGGDRCGLPHSALSEPALIARSCDGVLRHARSLTTAALIHAVRAQKRTAATPEVNAALMKPHWRSQDHWLNPETPARTSP